MFCFLTVVQCIDFHELSFIQPQEGGVGRGLGATLLAPSRLQTKANKDGEMEKDEGEKCTVQSERADDLTTDVGTFPPPESGIILAEHWERFQGHHIVKSGLEENLLVPVGGCCPQTDTNRAQVLAKSLKEFGPFEVETRKHAKQNLNLTGSQTRSGLTGATRTSTGF